MFGPLLATKLYVPPPRANLVVRTRLTERLDDGLEQGRRLTLVSAPAGSGKTTLISAWVYEGRRPMAWLSLDEGDNDPVQFLRYLIAALQQVDERTGETVAPLLQSPQLPPLPALLTPVINDVAASGVPVTLVLDDYHCITDAGVHEIVAFLLDNQPPSLHVAIGTREDPPLPLPRLRARGQVTEIRQRDLRFTPEEAAEFMRVTMGLPISAVAVAALAERTEGWIAGLQLAALALQDSPGDTAAFARAFTGDDRYVMEYLVAEVLQRQPEPVRAFLRQTAVLDRLTAPLCNALTDRHDAQGMLEQLEAANLFLIALDHRRVWYRYHQLFAGTLRALLAPDERQQAHARAARWYEANGFPHEAIQHALAAGTPDQDSPALDDAERLICETADDTIHSGGVLTLRAWLDALPDERVRRHARLATYKGWLLALTGNLAGAADYASAAETAMAGVETAGRERGVLLTLRGFIALMAQDHTAAVSLARDALQQLPPADGHWRVTAQWTLAEALEHSGNIPEAITTLYEALRAGLSLGNRLFVLTVENSLALALCNHGRLREGLRVCYEAIERDSAAGSRPSPLAGMLFGRLGMLHYEANALEEAREAHERGLALSAQLGLSYYVTISRGLAAPTLHALGDTAAALDALKEAYQVALQSRYVDPDWYLAAEAAIRLQGGDVAFARRWADTTGIAADTEPQYLRIERHLVYCRLLLAEGRPAEAQERLDRLAAFLTACDLQLPLIATNLLKALAAEDLGDRAGAREHLSHAVRLAAPDGYYRAFLDADDRVLGLLPAVRQAAPAFVDQLLAYAGVPAPARPAPPPGGLVEPLSERELEVLRLIAEGLSNQEIAGKLYITAGTVKRHINSIYGKLDVHSRTQALARAAALKLLA